MTGPSRRAFIKSIGVSCTALTMQTNLFPTGFRDSRPIRLGVIADLHGGLAVDADRRLDRFVQSMESNSCDALIQLGDFAFPNPKHQSYADKFNAAHQNTIHVIGNHEFDFGLTRQDCFQAWGIESAYYRTDVAGMRLLILDGNEPGSPDHKGGYPSYVGKQQQEWLVAELDRADCPLMIASHQPLAGQSAIDNAIEIQQLLARYQDKILLCINGHSHVDCLVPVEGVNYLHINSASYFWVGGETRMAYYRDPLFTMITIDPEKSTVRLEPGTSTWLQKSPADIGYFERDHAPPETIVVPAIRGREIDVRNQRVKSRPVGQRTNEQAVASGKGTPLKVMTWNIWGRLNQDPRYTVDDQTARQRAIQIIRDSGADIVAMVEAYGSAEDIATALGFHHHTPSADANLCIFSRYPLSDVEMLEGISPFSFIAATVNLPGGRQVRVYDIWLTSSGRHIVEIKDANLSDESFCQGDDLRFDHLQDLLNHEDFKQHLANCEQVPVIVAGDFNCVSHLDYTRSTRHSKLNQSRVLPIKVSRAMHQAGFSDSYRQANPDILKSTLGYTWTTVGMGFVYQQDKGFVPVDENPEPEYRDPYTRIDYIYSCGSRLKAVSSSVISHHPSRSDRSFPEFPSDHAAVLTTFVFH